MTSRTALKNVCFCEGEIRLARSAKLPFGGLVSPANRRRKIKPRKASHRTRNSLGGITTSAVDVAKRTLRCTATSGKRDAGGEVSARIVSFGLLPVILWSRRSLIGVHVGFPTAASTAACLRRCA